MTCYLYLNSRTIENRIYLCLSSMGFSRCIEKSSESLYIRVSIPPSCSCGWFRDNIRHGNSCKLSILSYLYSYHALDTISIIYITYLLSLLEHTKGTAIFVKYSTKWGDAQTLVEDCMYRSQWSNWKPVSFEIYDRWTKRCMIDSCVKQ